MLHIIEMEGRICTKWYLWFKQDNVEPEFFEIHFVKRCYHGAQLKIIREIDELTVVLRRTKTWVSVISV